MGFFVILAMVILVGFLFYTIDVMTKVQADVQLVAAYVKQQQQKRAAASKPVVSLS
jgi:hypothetical protein